MSGNYRSVLMPGEPDWSAGRRALAEVIAAGDDHFPCERWGHNDLFDGPESLDRDVLESWSALETEDVIPELFDPNIIPPEPSEDRAIADELEVLLSEMDDTVNTDRRDSLIDNAPEILLREKAEDFVSALLTTYRSSRPTKATTNVKGVADSPDPFINYVMNYAVPIDGLEENGYDRDRLVSAVETIAANGELTIQDRIGLVREAYESVLDRTSALRLRRNIADAMLDDRVARKRAKKQTLALIKPEIPLEKDIGVYKTDYSRDTVIDDVYERIDRMFSRHVNT